MRSIFNPKLRRSAEVSVSVITNNYMMKGLNMNQLDEQKSITPEITSSRKQFKGNSKQAKSHREEGASVKVTSTPVSDNHSTKATGFNVFYPAIGMANRHKYAVSHYEVNLTPVDLRNTSTQTNRYLANETTPAVRNYIKLGGPEFHRRVMMAATQANAKFLVTTGTLQPLINAFYGHMYNSRILYSLLCTAWRCQNQVNVIDEDQVYFSPMLNAHDVRNLGQGYSNTSFADSVGATTFTTNTVRQGYCFADATSNGVWANSIITPALQYTRLTPGWTKWIEEKFMRTYVIDPTDFNTAPRFLVFWPTGAGVTSGTEGLQVFTSYQQYTDETQRYASNATIPDLINHINALAFHQAQFVADYPQLELMWEYLNMSSPTTSFTRDLDAKSLPVIHSYSVSKLIRSSAAGFSKCISQVSASEMFYFDYVDSAIYISRDPVSREQSFRTFEMASSTRTVANITYLDRVELDEGDFAICSGLIAPLSLKLMMTNSSNGNYVWTLPLLNLCMQSGRVEAITPNGTTFGGQVYNYVAALMQLSSILTQESAILPRQRLQLYGNTTQGSFSSTTYLPIVSGGGNVNPQLPYYNLKDYYVPALEADGWRDSFLDMVLAK